MKRIVGAWHLTSDEYVEMLKSEERKKKEAEDLKKNKRKMKESTRRLKEKMKRTSWKNKQQEGRKWRTGRGNS